jgi:hypothetical protein
MDINIKQDLTEAEIFETGDERTLSGSCLMASFGIGYFDSFGSAVQIISCLVS